MSIKHIFVCSQIVSVSLLKRFTLRAVTAAESLLNVTAIEKHTLAGRTSPLSPYMGVPPPPGVRTTTISYIYKWYSQKLTTIFQYILFPDDTNLFLQNQNLNQMMRIANQEIKNVSQWLDSNKLTLNVSKTNFMIFRTRKIKINMPVRITIEDKNIEHVKSTKMLFLTSELANKAEIAILSARDTTRAWVPGGASWVEM